MKRTVISPLASWAALAAAALTLPACGSASAPQSELSDAKSAASVAAAQGAEEVPKASLYLKMARDGIDEAERLIGEEKYERAREILEQAEIDANLARSLAREAETQREAEEAIEKVKKLSSLEKVARAA